MATCDEEVYHQGHALLVVRGGTSEIMEDLISKISTSTVRFDWFFHGGVPVLLYLGPYDEARASLKGSLSWLNDELWNERMKFDHHARQEKFWAEAGQPSGRHDFTEQDFALPNSKTIGQIWNPRK